ncbi:hypothetical protein [Amycolatopsis sp. NBC_01480]|uniref:hypothetical protein n=1 Tax=Amycolatopsis sp. NBC_01480 TaxID=2903562 RepID=UPI002E2E5658|nr:hypothetical protein [Amycolatopsis sp. NBC_01480]
MRFRVARSAAVLAGAAALLTAMPAAAAVGTDGWSGVQGTQPVAAPAGNDSWSGTSCTDCGWGY